MCRRSQAASKYSDADYRKPNRTTKEKRCRRSQSEVMRQLSTDESTSEDEHLGTPPRGSIDSKPRTVKNLH